MLRRPVNVVSRRRLLGWLMVCGTATAGMAMAAIYAADPATPPAANSGAASLRRATDASSADAAKSPSDGKGRIDGYLAGSRWREGSKLVDVTGQFKTSGERVAFHAADGKSRFACLENLNSERVSRIVAESPEALEWTVQGTLTEFRNENYLLLTQAVIRSRAVRGPRTAGERAPPAGDPGEKAPARGF